MKIKIGTRGSTLALIQTKEVICAIKEKFPLVEVELLIIKTSGDNLSTPLGKPKNIGMFVKEIEDQLLKERIDLAVHSLKDLPTALPRGLAVGAVLKRSEPGDVLVSLKYNLSDLPAGAVIGTGSIRRRAQLCRVNPSFIFKDLRGNMETRLKKLKSENLDGIICAQSALLRLNIIDRIGAPKDEKHSGYKFTLIPFEVMLPAPGQGVIAVEYAEKNAAVFEILKKINCEQTFFEAETERTFLSCLGTGCIVPAGAFCSAGDGQIELEGFLADDCFSFFRREKLLYPLNDARSIGRDLAEILKKES